MNYILTSIEPVISCHGSFINLAAARNYAYELQKLGLCTKYNVGRYENGKFKEVYAPF